MTDHHPTIDTPIVHQAVADRCAVAPTGPHGDRAATVRLRTRCGGLPRLFAVLRTAGDRRAGAVIAWGIEFPDGTAATYGGGESFGSWHSAPFAAAVLGGGGDLVYITS